MEGRDDFRVVEENLPRLNLTRGELLQKFNQLGNGIVMLDTLFTDNLKVCSECKRLYISKELKKRLNALKINSSWAIPIPKKMMLDVILLFNLLSQAMFLGDFGSRIEYPYRGKCISCNADELWLNIEEIRQSQIKEGYEDCFRRKDACNQMGCCWRADCLPDEGYELRLQVFKQYSKYIN